MIITAETAKTMMDSQEVVILDVRADWEYAAAHIAGAVLMPYDQICALAPEKLPDKEQPILLYCRTGTRSAIAAGTLCGMGYTEVYDFGSIESWPYGTSTE